jgi:hypothetical protein
MIVTGIYIIAQHPQLARCVGQRHEAISRGGTFYCARTKADVPFAHPLPRPQLHYVVVQRDLGMRVRHQQRRFFARVLAIRSFSAQ